MPSITHQASTATPAQDQRPKLRLILAPLLDHTAHHPIDHHRVNGGILAAYNPQQLDRAEAVHILETVYEADLEDVTSPATLAFIPARVPVVDTPEAQQ